MSGPDPQLMPLRCLIVDDEEPARKLIENFLGRLPNTQLVASCRHPLEAAGYLEQTDVIFLDIQMPEMTGMQFIRSMARKPQVIVTTAYPEYALEGFQLEVTDYLVKPFAFERFFQAVQKAAEWKRLRGLEATQAPPAAGPGPAGRDHLMVKADGKLIKIRLAELLWVQSKGEYVQYRTPGGKVLVLGSLRELETLLPAEQFLRVHKSWLVNLDKVDALEGNQLYIAGDKVPVGASYKEALKQRL